MTRAWRAWRAWAFDPVDTASMAVLRIALGLLVVGWTVSYLPDVHTYLAHSGGLRPPTTYQPAEWRLPDWSPMPMALTLLVAAIGVTVGFCTRLSAIIVWLLLVDLQRRNVYVLDSGDLLLRELAFLVALMPSGESWSIDARLRRRAPRPRAPWAVRLVQVQVSVMYLFSVWAKVRGHDWNDGTALGLILQVKDLQILVLPHWLTTSILISSLLTYGTLALELSLVVGLWLPRTRNLFLALGASLHLGIALTIITGWFPFVVLACYAAFVPPATFRRLAARLPERRRGESRRTRPA